MKHTNQILAVAVIGTGILSLQSCKKYEDGPMLSLRSKTARLTGEWLLTGGTTLDDFATPGVDIDLFIEFMKDGDLDMKISGTYDYYGTPVPISFTQAGTWEWADGKEGLMVTMGEGAYMSMQDWTIHRLTNKELHGESIDDDLDVYTFEFEKEK